MNECVVVEAVRCPTGRAGWGGTKKGQLSEVSSHDLISSAIEGLIEKVKAKCPKFDVNEIEDVCVSVSSQVGEQAGNLGRVAVLAAGLPTEVPGWTVDRYCPAGLQAINAQSMAIISGYGDIMIAAGVEAMSRYPLGSSVFAADRAEGICGRSLSSERSSSRPSMPVPMGYAADLVAQKYELRREDLDKYSLQSQIRACKSIDDKDAYFERVVPVTVIEGDQKKVVATVDEPPRRACLEDPEGSLAKMASLPPRFMPEGGTTTAASASGIVDGSAACMLMSAQKAKELGIKPLARIVSMAVAASDPTLMLLGPIPAMNKALQRAGLTMKDIDVLEANEAFASPILAFCKEYDIPYTSDRINPTGGAIAIGHPIGASGLIYFCEMLHWMNRNKLRYGIETLCGGGGVGIATVVERVN